MATFKNHILEALDKPKGIFDNPDYSFVTTQARLLLQKIADKQPANKKWWLQQTIERCPSSLLPMVRIVLNEYVCVRVYCKETNLTPRAEVRRTWPYVAMYFPIDEVDAILKCVTLLHRTRVDHQLFAKKYLESQDDVRVMPEFVKETLRFQNGRLIVKLESKRFGTQEAVL